MTEWVEQWICIKFCIKLWTFLCRNYSGGSEGFQGWCNECSTNKSVAQTLQRWLRICWKWSMFWTACNKQNTWECWMCTGCSQQRLVAQVTQPPYSPDLVPCDFWLFPKLKSPLKKRRFQTIDEIQEYCQNRAADGDSNKGFCREFWTMEEMLGELCEVPRCLLWRDLRHHCPMYNVSCILYLLQ